MELILRTTVLPLNKVIITDKQLIDKEIVVRNRTKEQGCNNCLRFTIGTPEENTKLLTVLKSLT